MSRQVEIRAPAEQTEGTRSQILRWLKSIGDEVAENEPLIEIETDKVTVEVASPGSGTLREIVKQEQEEIAPGELLGRIEAHGAGAEGLQVGALAGVAAEADHGPVATGRESAAAGRASGAGSDGVMPGEVSARVAGVPPARGRGGANGASSGGGDTGAAVASARAAGSHSLSPAVRRLLSERGLDPADIHGTGQGGRITVADVMNHSGTSATHSVASTGAAVDTGGGPGSRELSESASPRGDSAAVTVGAGATDLGPSRRVPHTATRKRIAEHMVQSLLHTAPHVTTVFEADLSAVLEHRERNKAEFARQNVPLTLTAYFLQAVVAAIRVVPEANSRWSEDSLEIFDSMHIGVATALETGLVVPVLRDVQSRDLFETARGLEDLISRAREGRLLPADVRGGTFTISNHGVSGSIVATPIIINQPQSAILGVGKLEKRPVVVSEGGDDSLVIRPLCYVTLTLDHRVMDGHQANRFLQTFVKRLASWNS